MCDIARRCNFTSSGRIRWPVRIDRPVSPLVLPSLIRARRLRHRSAARISIRRCRSTLRVDLIVIRALHLRLPFHIVPGLRRARNITSRPVVPIRVRIGGRLGDRVAERVRIVRLTVHISRSRHCRTRHIHRRRAAIRLISTRLIDRRRSSLLISTRLIDRGSSSTRRIPNRSSAPRCRCGTVGP